MIEAIRILDIDFHEGRFDTRWTIDKELVIVCRDSFMDEEVLSGSIEDFFF